MQPMLCFALEWSDVTWWGPTLCTAPIISPFSSATIGIFSHLPNTCIAHSLIISRKGLILTLGFPGNFLGVEDGFPNTSLVLVEHGYITHSFCPSHSIGWRSVSRLLIYGYNLAIALRKCKWLPCLDEPPFPLSWKKRWLFTQNAIEIVKSLFWRPQPTLNNPLAWHCYIYYPVVPSGDHWYLLWKMLNHYLCHA